MLLGNHKFWGAAILAHTQLLPNTSPQVSNQGGLHFLWLYVIYLSVANHGCLLSVESHEPLLAISGVREARILYRAK